MEEQEQFFPLDNYRNELDKPVQLEIFPEEAKAQIVDVFNANPKDISNKSQDIKRLDADELYSANSIEK